MATPSGGDERPDSLDGARRILSELGRDGTPLPCPSRTNSVWATDVLVLKISLVPDTSDLFEEAELVRALPPAVGAPFPIASGRLDGHAWSAWRREPGQNMGELWPSLSRPQRCAAVAQGWERLSLLRHYETTPFRDRVPPMAFSYRALDPTYADQLLAEANLSGWVPHGLARTLSGLFDAMHEAVEQAPRGLAHADAHLHNFLYLDGRLTAIMDWEAAFVGPADLDLDLVARTVCHPMLAHPQRADRMMESPPDEEIAELGRVAQESFRDLLSLPGAGDRLAGYDASWLLERVVRRARWAPSLVPVTMEAVERLVAGRTLARRAGWDL